MADETSDEQYGLSIGALSKATGVPVETLRTWERRYGFPNPERNDSGHRIYSPNTIERLRLIDAALKQGLRAATALAMPEDALRQAVSNRLEEQVDEDPWMDAVKRFDGETLEQLMRGDWNALGALPFFTKRLQPFLEDVGNAWMNNRIDVAHEHFASERVRDFLTQQWRPMSDRATGPLVLAATLPSETHYLGLQMACTILAIAGCKILYLGADTPVEDVVTTVSKRSVDAVCVSVSVAANRSMTVRDLSHLRARLNPAVELVVGGMGAPQQIGGIHTITGLNELFTWSKSLAKQQRLPH